MNAHPKDRGERRKIKDAEKRRAFQIREALKKQEAEDERKAQIERERLLASPGRSPGDGPGTLVENNGIRVTI